MRKNVWKDSEEVEIEVRESARRERTRKNYGKKEDRTNPSLDPRSGKNCTCVGSNRKLQRRLRHDVR